MLVVVGESGVAWLASLLLIGKRGFQCLLQRARVQPSGSRSRGVKGREVAPGGVVDPQGK